MTHEESMVESENRKRERTEMKSGKMRRLGAEALVGIVALAGCAPKSDSGSPGAGEKAGAALDRAAEKTEAGAANAVDKTGEALEKAGENMQK